MNERKLMPSRRGQVSRVAPWRAHSAGMRKLREAGEFLTEVLRRAVPEFEGTELTEFLREGREALPNFKCSRSQTPSGNAFAEAIPSPI